MLPHADHTTSEVWRDIPGFPDLRISDRNRVLFLKEPWHCKQRELYDPTLGGMILPQRKNRAGYLYVDVRYPRQTPIRLLVHRLLLTALVGPCPPGLEGCHKDDNKLNNSPGNLYWGTHRENMVQAHANRRIPRTVIYPEDRPKVYQMFDSGMTPSEIAVHFGVTTAGISAILVKSGRRTSKRYTRQDVERFEGMRSSGMTLDAIAIECGASMVGVWHALKKGSAAYPPA